ncbi:MAG: cAMP phosphodiesterase [Cyanobacteriota bacterium]
MRRPIRLLRCLFSLLCGLLLAPVLIGASPALAALPTAPRPQLPASEATMDLYMRLSAINFCLARSIGSLDVAKAVPIAGETVVVLLQNEHGSRITSVGDKPLSLEELRRGAYDSVLLGALTFCPKDIPDDVRQSLEAAIKAQALQPSTSETPGENSTATLPVASAPADGVAQAAT